MPFLGLLGYELRYNQKAHDVDGLSFAISHRAGEEIESPPIHVVGFRQELGRVPASGRPRLAPHSLVQEYLNREKALWGLVTNGRILRLLRDCTFVRRQAYLEFDLPAILDEQRFQDFVALYRLLHRTRLPRGADDASDCLLEKYYFHSVEQGGRVRERLRDGVEECITLLANGFLRHRENGELRGRLAARSNGVAPLAPEELYRQLLILVYRLLFLLVSEDRGLLSPDPIYRGHYSIGRLRRLIDQRAAFTNHDDLWNSLRVLWRVLIKDDLHAALGGQTMAAALGLPVLNGDLFAEQDLDVASISNRDLLEAIRRLTWYQEGRNSPPRRVNYAALDVEELGSVYESLLDFHPAIDSDHAGRLTFSFVSGSERKTTGSYYTPPELVAELIKSALETVLADRLKSASTKATKEKAILSIRVCDPACGSGHFLLAAARRLGKELARVRTGEQEPAPERVREAVRDVISHSIYGVDKNPLAVDLCRVALWLEGHTADKPLTFLDHRIRCGDSLVGVFDLKTLEAGIPDEAFKPFEGDDKQVAKELKATNRKERRDRESGQRQLQFDPSQALSTWTLQARELDAIEDDSPEAIRSKKQLYRSIRQAPEAVKQREACDLWAAAFFQPFRANYPGITTASVLDHLAGRSIDHRLISKALTISVRQRFFHWPLEFPEVFADSGFDVVLSNPPWERVKLQEQEFFASRDAKIAMAPNKAARQRLINDLPETNPKLHEEFVDALRGAAGASAIMRHGGRFPLTGRGDINTYAVFAEQATIAINGGGRSGLILPKGIATDDTTKEFFGSLVSGGRLVDLIGFENEEFIFPAVDHRVTFCKITIAGASGERHQSRIGFHIRRFSQLAEEERFFTLSPGDFWLLNPNTGNCPIFRTKADAELTKAIYRRVPILWREGKEGRPAVNPWRLSFSRMFDMSNDSHLFRTADDLRAENYRLEGNVFVGPTDRYLPLYEAKMLHQFDHRFSTYEGATEKQLNVGILPQPTVEQKRDPTFVVQPRYWIREEIVESAIPKYPPLLASAIAIESREAIQHVFLWWTAGHYLELGDESSTSVRLAAARELDGNKRDSAEDYLLEVENTCRDLQQCFPLTETDIAAIDEQFKNPQTLAEELVARFSPKWLMGSRLITNTTNERTIIAFAFPKSACGNSAFLLFSEVHDSRKRLAFLGTLAGFAFDYAARQKLGGTNANYFFVRQLPVPSPSMFDDCWSNGLSAEWISRRVLELTYTAHDLTSIAGDMEHRGPPFHWDEERRFQIRCELDAAIFHLYLPSTETGAWKPSPDESRDQLDSLREHFPTPRNAVAHILDSFPITRQNDEKAHGTYRTKDRILEIYDAMLAAQHDGEPFRSALVPQPGQQNGAAAHLMKS